VDINAMGRDDLQAAGKILITQMQAACASKKKAEKKIS
jgi:hypothetical protein